MSRTQQKYRAIDRFLATLSVLLMPAAALAQSATEMTVYGHAMLDMGYQAKAADPNWFDVMRPTKLPSFDGEFGSDGSFYSSVRQSRLGVSTVTDTSKGPLKTLFEFELFGVGADEGQTTFRLRHAWGELGQFGAGQYNSVFMDFDVFPNSIEYWGPNAMVLFRNVQVRWTPWQAENGSRFAISLERPGASGDQGEFEDRIELENIEGKFEVPDLAVHYRHVRDWGHVQAAGIVRQIKWKDLSDNPTDLSGQETGWGLNLSGNLKLGPHVLRGSVVFGEGIQNYMNDATADIAVAENQDDPNRPFLGKAVPMVGVVAFLDLNWSEEWTSTIGYSVLDLDLPEGQLADSFARGQYALANVLWHPVDNVFVGPEIQWIQRDNFRDGFTSDDLKIQVSFKYSFSSTFGGNAQ